MGIQSMSSYPKCYRLIRKGSNKKPCWAWRGKEVVAVYLNANINYFKWSTHGRRVESCVVSHWKSFVANASDSKEQLIEGSIQEKKKNEKKGTITGAVALIIGTSIGSGILALPKKTAPAGFIPSATVMVLCWGFLLMEALFLAEMNVSLRRKKKKREAEDTLEIISITTMAQEALGEWGGTMTTINYIFLAYTSMVAYTCKSGEILSHLINLPTSISGILFTIFFTIMISFGGTRLTDQINQWLTASMIGLLVLIEVIASLSGGWSELTSTANWARAPATIPVIIFALVYHDLTPVICTYLGGDLTRIRVSFVIGSIMPLLALIVWDAVALSLSSNTNNVDPIDLLMSVKWSGMSPIVEAFSLLAVGTSLIGTILGFSQFFLEQLNLMFDSPSIQIKEERDEKKQLTKTERDRSIHFLFEDRWRNNKVYSTAMAMAMAVVPPLIVSTTYPDAFSMATDIAGGYCMTMLYGVLPPVMAWTMHAKSCEDNGGGDGDQKMLSRAKPALLGVGLFACGIVLEQMLQDLSILHP